MSIKMVAFDLFGIVFTEGHMVSGTLMKLMPETAQQPIVKGAYNQFTRGEMSEEQFWEKVEQAGNETLRNNFLNAFELDPDLEEVTRVLSKKYQLSILSNLAKEWAEVLVAKYRFDQTFSPRIISGEVNCEKPDRAIYKKLLEQSPYKAEEIVFIDDRLENLETAKQLGMATIHYYREPDACEYVADYRVDRLGQVLEFLD